MIKLKEVICQLDKETYELLEFDLEKTKALNFLQVLRSYREGQSTDKEILEKLNISTNAFFVLKSRLFDRVREKIMYANSEHGKNNLPAQLEEAKVIGYGSPQETATAFLLQLEKILILSEMNLELLTVYCALKKLHYNSDKYFHYSQLHNKHVAYWLSLEKAEDTLSDFSFLLEEYVLSRSQDAIEKLKFLREEINNHSALKTSKQLEIIKSIMDIELMLFCKVEPAPGFDTEQMLVKALETAEQLTEVTSKTKWGTALNYLAFEYYYQNGSTNKALEYYEKTNQIFQRLLLFSNVSLIAKFLTTKIHFLTSKKEVPLVLESSDFEFICNENLYSKVQAALYKAMIYYYSKEIKKAIDKLNEILNIFSLKDYFHSRMEVSFTLAFLYLSNNKIDLAESLIISIYRKIKTDKLDHYTNALDLIKFFNTFFKVNENDSNKAKRQESLLLFFARNTGEYAVLTHLEPELKNNYLK